MKFIYLIFIILCLSACLNRSIEHLKGHADDLNSPQRFGICYGYGCKFYIKTGLNKTEWAEVRALFNGDIKNAQQERVVIGTAIALIEQYIGPKTGTDNDKARARIINFSTKGQMDCVDEAFNTSSYLYLLKQDGLIKMHSLGAPLRRNLNQLSYPHSSATIYEMKFLKKIAAEGHYVVDSWFHKNGALPEIIPASRWMGPWYPEIKRQRYNFSAS